MKVDLVTDNKISNNKIPEYNARKEIFDYIDSLSVAGFIKLNEEQLTRLTDLIDEFGSDSFDEGYSQSLHENGGF